MFLVFHEIFGLAVLINFVLIYKKKSESLSYLYQRMISFNDDEIKTQETNSKFSFMET